jgi:hypothetical protein
LISCITKSNSSPVLNVIGHLVANASPAVIELVGTAMDITEREHVEDKSENRKQSSVRFWTPGLNICQC